MVRKDLFIQRTGTSMDKAQLHPDTIQNRFKLYVGINHSCFWGTFYVLLFQSRYRSAGNSKQRADTSKKQQTDKGKRKLSSFCNSLVIRFFRWNFFCVLCHQTFFDWMAPASHIELQYKASRECSLLSVSFYAFLQLCSFFGWYCEVKWSQHSFHVVGRCVS